MFNHSFVRYLWAGSVVFILSGLQYRIVYTLVYPGPMQAALAWTIHFLIGTIWTHAIHRWFTFRFAPHFSYWVSLVRTLGASSAIGVMSTAMIWLLCDVGRIDPFAGWLMTTSTAALINYCAMRFFTIVVR